jgi:hypothetical protein
MVCTSCGIIRADARPNYKEQPPRETLTGCDGALELLEPAQRHVDFPEASGGAERPMCGCLLFSFLKDTGQIAVKEFL